LLLCSLFEDPEVNESAAEVGGFSTVDHADIRGSARAAFMVHDASGAASHWARGLVAAQRNRGFSTVGRLDR